MAGNSSGDIYAVPSMLYMRSAMANEKRKVWKNPILLLPWRVESL